MTNKKTSKERTITWHTYYAIRHDPITNLWELVTRTSKRCKWKAVTRRDVVNGTDRQIPVRADNPADLMQFVDCSAGINYKASFDITLNYPVTIRDLETLTN